MTRTQGETLSLMILVPFMVMTFKWTEHNSMWLFFCSCWILCRQSKLFFIHWDPGKALYCSESSHISFLMYCQADGDFWSVPTKLTSPADIWWLVLTGIYLKGRGTSFCWCSPFYILLKNQLNLDKPIGRNEVSPICLFRTSMKMSSFVYMILDKR